MKTFAPTQTDFYKIGHITQYPKGTEYVYSNMTARSGYHSNVPDSKGVLFIGLQLFIKDYLIDCWNETFFNQPKLKVLDKFAKRVDTGLGHLIDVNHMAALHDLKYLPIKIKALPEGSFVPYKVPMLTIVNTHPDFFWLTNSLESVMSAYLWQMINSATTYREYKRVFTKYALETGAPLDIVPFQAHDFSFRGMAGHEAAARSAFAVIAAGCKGTDSIAGIDVAEDYYNATGFIAGSVNATEHSVMCAGSKDGEEETFKRLLTEIYPEGVLSIVSDTWDFWKVVTETLPKLKDIILAREGSLVIRPDSGDPADIICGNLDWHRPYDLGDECAGEAEFAYTGGHRLVKQNGKTYNLGRGGNLEELKAEQKGLIECLWDTFGGHINEKGYKVLDPHIGAIYGDSITLARQDDILQRLKAKGFSSSNIILGVGSYTYQMTSRDTHGMAIKATSVTVKGERRDIFKDPKTDDGTKKSAKGLLMVTQIGKDYELRDQVTIAEEARGALETVFLDGYLLKETSLDEIRKRVEYGIS